VHFSWVSNSQPLGSDTSGDINVTSAHTVGDTAGRILALESKLVMLESLVDACESCSMEAVGEERPVQVEQCAQEEQGAESAGLELPTPRGSDSRGENEAMIDDTPNHRKFLEVQP
jgi:hypothetical protein